MTCPTSCPASGFHQENSVRHALIALLVIAPLAARADDAVVVKELLDKAMKAQ